MAIFISLSFQVAPEELLLNAEKRNVCVGWLVI
jgi:hypothetical protein